MKTRKTVWVALAAAVIAAFLVGAGERKADRPSAIGEERWIPAGERAGFALTAESADTSVGAELYLKTAKGWRRARVENPVSAQLLGR
jgi:hypothetical protein